ncbi:hypothetical protein AURDEDRAFT_110664 [Auricularia subglabra TFB-10046 SS5]|nr:hypothetical protein AURDEDRAFT_110664 [Auricularia subglabra TFB-10046 SS5]
MRTTTSLIALSAPLLASAAPLFSRGASDTDILVFKFAHVLEQLETQFYQQAIAKFKVEDFLAAGYSSAEVAVEQLQTIVADEAAHTSTLEAAIKSFGAEPLTTCQFNFDSVLTDVATTMTVARVVEMTGVGAYLGGAGLLDDPRFITTAATILTIEARHSTILNSLNGGVAVPQAFDIPLAPEQVLAIAGSFISGCDLGIPANPSLAVTNTGPIAAGTLLQFQSDAIKNWDPTCPLFCNMIVGGAVNSITLPIEQCVVPAGVNGPVALMVTSDPQPLLASDIIDQSKKNIVAGPTIAFLDFGVKEQTLSQLILTPGSKLTKDLNGVSQVAASCSSGSCQPVASDSTATISPQAASGVMEQAGAPATVAPQTTSTVSDPAAATATQIFQGDITPVMPAAGGAAEAPVGSAGLPIVLPTDAVGSNGLPIATPVDTGALPVATPPASGSGAASSDEFIVPLVPSGGAAAEAAPAPVSVAPVAAPQPAALNVASEPVQVLGFDDE